MLGDSYSYLQQVQTYVLRPSNDTANFQEIDTFFAEIPPKSKTRNNAGFNFAPFKFPANLPRIHRRAGSGHMRIRGFTLVEIMIVILIIGLLLAIAAPSWLRSRELSRSRQCIATLKQIEGGKEFMANELNLPNGTPCVMGDLWPTYIRRSTPPICSAGGTLLVNPIGIEPDCTYVNPTFPHELP